MLLRSLEVDVVQYSTNLNTSQTEKKKMERKPRQK